MKMFDDVVFITLGVLGVIALAKYLSIGPILVGLFVALTQ